MQALALKDRVSFWQRCFKRCQDAIQAEFAETTEALGRAKRVAAARWHLPDDRWPGRDGTYPEVGNDVEYVEMGGCMAHIERMRERGKVLKIDAWKPVGAFYPHIYMLVDFPSGQRWEPMECYARERADQLHYRSN